MSPMTSALLEVIALDAEDARRAEAGGADRIELVSAMDQAGLSPAPATVAAVRAAVAIPVRTMLRVTGGFAAGDLDGLRRTARDLASAGADAFVLGFLDAAGDVDAAAMTAALEALDGHPWTFHRALDHAADRPAAWAAFEKLPGLDCVLTAGDPAGVTAGLPVLLADAAAGRAGTLLAGGGLRPEHVPALRAAGVTAFHTGGAVRPGGAWSEPIDPNLVTAWRDRIQPGRGAVPGRPRT